jgi:hypothetical protein
MAAASTVRFAELVKRGGAPEVHLSWVAPAKDPELQRALKQHRLVTLHQHARGPRDFGVVGFEPGRDAQFLVFPKSLRAFAGRKVIGIKYELLQEAAAASGQAPTSTSHEKQKSEKPKSRIARATRPARGKSKPREERPREREPEPEPEADFITDTDPLKREVRKALIALSAGRTGEAKRRLQGILSGGSER